MVRITPEILTRMRVPEVHWDCKLSNIPKSCPHKEFVSDYVDHIVENIGTPKGLLLFGEYSCGKSGLAAVILKAAAFNREIGLWVVARRLPEYQIEKEQFDSKMTVIQRAETVPILVLDELVLRAEIRFSEQAVESLVRRRVDDRLCTIITTNHTPTFIAEKYPALYAVLQEAVYPVKISGHDFRKDRASTLKGVR